MQSGWVYPMVKYKPGFATTIMGSDGDGLPDSFERAAGLSTTSVDSDNDRHDDAAELPLAALPTGDPLLANGIVTCVP